MRNLSTAGMNFLRGNSSITIFHLVMLETAASTEADPKYHYITDAPMSITFDGKQYAANKLTKVGSLTMGTGLQTHKLNIEVAGEYQEELNRALVGPADNESYLNKEIVVNRVYLDDTGAIVSVSDTDALHYFKGLITNININEAVKEGASTVTWSCANHFEDFNAVNGRLTDDYVHRGLVSINNVLTPSVAAKRTAYQSDKGFTHANTAVDVLAKYTTKEKRYKTKSSWGGFKTKTREYEVDVVNELDLKFDLAAKYLPVIYGVRKVSGIPVFIDVDNSTGNTVYVVYAVCEGEIDGFLDVYIEGSPAICSDASHGDEIICIGNQQAGNTLGVADNSGVGPNDPVAHGRTLIVDTDHTKAKFTFYNGKSNQDVDPILRNLSLNERFILQKTGDTDYWSADHKLLDTAYVVMEYVLNEDATTVPEIEFIVQGKKVDVYSTVNSSSKKYTLNPVWHILDYMGSDLYGGGLDSLEFNLQSFIDTATYLDTIDTSYEMNWLKYSRYLGWPDMNIDRRQKVQCNTLLPGNEAVLNNIKSVLEQFDGTLNLIDGRYSLTMKRVTPDIAHIDISDIIGRISTKEQNNKSTWNTIQANIQDPALAWSSNKITFFNNVYKQEDRGTEKKGNVSYKHITNYYTARARAETALNQSRYSREFSFKVWHAFSHLTPNDVITLTYDRFNFSYKKLMVKKVVANSDGTFDITAEDYDPSIYDTTDQGDNGANEGAIVPGVPKVGNIYVNPYVGDEIGVNAVLNWDAVNTPSISHYEVKYDAERFTVLHGVVKDIQDRGVVPYLDLYNLKPGRSYTFEIRTVLLDGRSSAWTSFIYVATAVDTNLPPITGFEVINVEPGSLDTFFGGSVLLSWDHLEDDNVDRYYIEIIDGSQDGQPDIGRTVYGSVYVSKSNDPTTEKSTYEYTLLNNMADYATNNNDAAGVYRDLGFRIRATNHMEGVSVYWSYIE